MTDVQSDYDLEVLIDKLRQAEQERSRIIARFIERVNYAGFVADDEVHRQWDVADEAVARARESIRNHVRFRRP